MRRLLLELRPTHWKNVDTEELLTQISTAVMGNSLIDVTVHITKPLPKLPTDTKIALYYITHEAVNNALKHTHTKKIAIQLEAQGTQLTLSIQDNGRGFDPTQVKHGMGLGNMVERTQEIGGEFQIENLPTGGTRISVRFNI